jgi:predicted ester cyclase
MSLEDNKELVRRFIDEVMNTGNTAALADFCVPGSMFAGGIAGQIKVRKTAFPDDHFTIEEMLAEGDKIAVQATIHGTNSGPMLGLPAFGRLEVPVPPTGKSVTGTAIFIFKVSDGKIVSYAFEFDQIGLLQQLGWTFTPPAQT